MSHMLSLWHKHTPTYSFQGLNMGDVVAMATTFLLSGYKSHYWGTYRRNMTLFFFSVWGSSVRQLERRRGEGYEWIMFFLNFVHVWRVFVIEMKLLRRVWCDLDMNPVPVHSAHSALRAFSTRTHPRMHTYTHTAFTLQFGLWPPDRFNGHSDRRNISLSVFGLQEYNNKWNPTWPSGHKLVEYRMQKMWYKEMSFFVYFP